MSAVEFHMQYLSGVAVFYFSRTEIHPDNQKNDEAGYGYNSKVVYTKKN